MLNKIKLNLLSILESIEIIIEHLPPFYEAVKKITKDNY